MDHTSCIRRPSWTRGLALPRGLVARAAGTWACRHISETLRWFRGYLPGGGRAGFYGNSVDVFFPTVAAPRHCRPPWDGAVTGAGGEQQQTVMAT